MCYFDLIDIYVGLHILPLTATVLFPMVLVFIAIAKKAVDISVRHLLSPGLSTLDRPSTPGHSRRQK